MAIPQLILRSAVLQIEHFCEQHSPEELREEVRLAAEVDDDAVLLVECRHEPTAPGAEWTTWPVARFEYSAGERQWSLHVRDHRRDWQPDPDVPPTADIHDLLDHVNDDPNGVFWDVAGVPVPVPGAS